MRTISGATLLARFPPTWQRCRRSCRFPPSPRGNHDTAEPSLSTAVRETFSRGFTELLNHPRLEIITVGAEDGAVGRRRGLDVQPAPGSLPEAEHGRDRRVRGLEILRDYPAELHSRGGIYNKPTNRP